MRFDPVQVAGSLAAFLTLLSVLPQFRRTVLGRQAAGLSPASMWLLLASSGGWLSYGLFTGDPVQIVTNVTVGLVFLAVAVTAAAVDPVCRRGAARWAPVTVLFVLGAVTAMAVFGPGMWVLVAAPWSIAANLPQPRRLWTMTGPANGVSPGSLRLTACGATAWTTYGLLTANPAVIVASSIQLSCALASLAALRWRCPPATVAVPAPRQAEVLPAAVIAAA